VVISVLGGPPEYPGLAEITFERQGDPAPAAPGSVPVVWDDIDLFGYPVSDLEAALPHVVAEEAGLTLGRPAASRYLTSARLSRRAATGGG